MCEHSWMCGQMCTREGMLGCPRGGLLGVPHHPLFGWQRCCEMLGDGCIYTHISVLFPRVERVLVHSRIALAVLSSPGVPPAMGTPLYPPAPASSDLQGGQSVPRSATRTRHFLRRRRKPEVPLWPVPGRGGPGGAMAGTAG